MRTFQIDFLNTENPLPDGNILGNQGEHNATVLVITPPAEMTANESITSYRIAFELSNCRAVHSGNIAKTDIISLPLFSQITSSETIAVQLEGYDGNGEIVVKSTKLTKLKFNPSVCGVEIPPSDSPNSMAAEVTRNTKFRENFNENENGNLTYKGNPIGSNPPYDTISLDSSQFFSSSISGDITELCLASEDIISLGTKIKTIRIKYEDKMIDIKNMAEVDGIPYILNMDNVVLSPTFNLPMLALFGCPYGANALINAFGEYSINNIEVDYYTYKERK